MKLCLLLYFIREVIKECHTTTFAVSFYCLFSFTKLEHEKLIPFFAYAHFYTTALYLKNIHTSMNQP